MNRSVLFVLLAVLALPANSQQVFPGGVKGLCLWNTTTSCGSNATLTSVAKALSDTFPSVSSKKYSLNNNPAVYFSGKNMDASLDLSRLSGFTLFTICQSTDTTSEQVIFCTEGDTSTEAVLTDHRLASLSDYKYANYDNRAKNYPRMYSYCHHNNKDTSIISRTLRLGQIPRKQSLPVQALSGIVPEIILYNHNLSYRERLRVESYLALKYGIPLGQQYPRPYLNSSGDTIWDADINAEYASDIAGIGRDDTSGLNQTISECVQAPGLMKISSASAMTNNSFVVWGDNGEAASFGEYHSLPKCLGRNWRLNTYNASGAKINFQTYALAIEEINPLSEGETYWLMLDQSGTGTYPFGKTSYIKCQNMASPRDTIKFNNVTADSDSSGADVFTLLAMPELFTRCIVNNPGCNNNGKLQVEIVGGTSPYTLVLTAQNTADFSQSLKTSDTTAEFTGITQGGYTLTVTDANNQTYSEEIWASNSHAWECGIKQQYEIKEGNSITLDASEGMPVGYTYSWTTPSGETTLSSTITIAQLGTYYLTVTDTEGCSSILKTSVAQYEVAAIEAVEVFPNPTKSDFVVRVELANTAALNITLADINGKVISTTTMKGESYYWCNGTLPAPGLYILTLRTLNSQKTLKLVGN